MPCNHAKLKCTNNVFYCLFCGEIVPNPYKDKPQEEKPTEGAKKPVKRRAKKEME